MEERLRIWQTEQELLDELVAIDGPGRPVCNTISEGFLDHEVEGGKKVPVKYDTYLLDANGNRIAFPVQLIGDVTYRIVSQG